MYFTFDNNQWVSFDNEVTFQQKVNWADSVGLGGAMIWASDLGSYRDILQYTDFGVVRY